MCSAVKKLLQLPVGMAQITMPTNFATGMYVLVDQLRVRQGPKNMFVVVSKWRLTYRRLK
jgi:hypothetical protein